MKHEYYEKLASGLQNQAKSVDSKFGSYILQKFGWQQGKGLGKNENGDVNLIKIKRQGEHGLGYEEKDHVAWWEQLYNQCAKKINNSVKHSGLVGEAKIDNDAATEEQKAQKCKSNNNNNVNVYSGFVKKQQCFVNESQGRKDEKTNTYEQQKESPTVKKNLSKKEKKEKQKKEKRKKEKRKKEKEKKKKRKRIKVEETDEMLKNKMNRSCDQLDERENAEIKKIKKKKEQNKDRNTESDLKKLNKHDHKRKKKEKHKHKSKIKKK